MALISKELILGFQIFDLKDHFSAFLKAFESYFVIKNTSDLYWRHGTVEH